MLSLIIFVSGALIYLRYAEPVYSISARMLIKDDNSKKNNASQILSNMEDFGFLTNSTGIDNEIEIIQSRILLRDAVKDLKLYTEYRRVGRVRDAILYGIQPLNVDLDPVHLDSLDINLLTGVRSIKMILSREGEYYVAKGDLWYGKQQVSSFERRFKSVPATFTTEYGTLTFTKNIGYDLESGEKCIVTILPPMQVATNYLDVLTVKPTSKQTSIALLTMKDRDIRRGMDFLRQLAICYNRQANADKNEIALKTEEFINDRISKITSELGSTEGAIEEFKKRNAVTDVGIDATSSVQMSAQYSAQLSEANAQIQILDNLREYVNNPKNKYQVIPSNVGMTDAASSALISSYNQTVQDRNRLLKAASEEAPQVRTLTATIEEPSKQYSECIDASPSRC